MSRPLAPCISLCQIVSNCVKLCQVSSSKSDYQHSLLRNARHPLAILGIPLPTKKESWHSWPPSLSLLGGGLSKKMQELMQRRQRLHRFLPSNFMLFMIFMFLLWKFDGDWNLIEEPDATPSQTRQNRGNFAWAFAAFRSETKVSRTSFLIYGCKGHIRPHQATSGHIILAYLELSLIRFFRYLDYVGLETLALFFDFFDLDAMRCTAAYSWPRCFRWSSAISSFSSAKGAANAELTAWPCHASHLPSQHLPQHSPVPIPWTSRPLDLRNKRHAKDMQKTKRRRLSKTQCLLNVISLASPMEIDPKISPSPPRIQNFIVAVIVIVLILWRVWLSLVKAMQLA